VRIDYPDPAEEAALVRQVTRDQVGERLHVEGVLAVMQPAEVLRAQTLAARLRVDDQVMDYCVRLVRATRDWRGIQMGAGPRGTIALVRAARAHALISGNGYVTPDDVKAVALAVLRHRLSLTPDLEIEGMEVDDVLRQLLADVKAPRA